MQQLTVRPAVCWNRLLISRHSAYFHSGRTFSQVKHIRRECNAARRLVITTDSKFPFQSSMFLRQQCYCTESGIKDENKEIQWDEETEQENDSILFTFSVWVIAFCIVWFIDWKLLRSLVKQYRTITFEQFEEWYLRRGGVVRVDVYTSKTGDRDVAVAKLYFVHQQFQSVTEEKDDQRYKDDTVLVETLKRGQFQEQLDEFESINNVPVKERIQVVQHNSVWKGESNLFKNMMLGIALSLLVKFMRSAWRLGRDFHFVYRILTEEKEKDVAKMKRKTGKRSKTKKNEQTISKEDAGMKKNEQTISKEDAGMKKNEQTISKEDAGMKKNEQTISKEDAGMKKNEQTISKEVAVEEVKVPFNLDQFLVNRGDKLMENKNTFKNVAGMHEPKAEFKDLIEYMNDPKKFAELGEKPPKGALLLGPPGCGKTLLAKALAGECKVPFYTMSGSEFVVPKKGEGALRVRSVFEEVRKSAPCIVYIDEIGAIGGNTSLKGDEKIENEQTLKELFAELDGKQAGDGVVVLASTSREELLNKALLSPGRLDRQIRIGLPTQKEREELFQHLLEKLNLKSPVEAISTRLAQLTPGMSGAEIAIICKLAAQNAARELKEEVNEKDFVYPIRRVTTGDRSGLEE